MASGRDFLHPARIFASFSLHETEIVPEKRKRLTNTSRYDNNTRTGIRRELIKRQGVGLWQNAKAKGLAMPEHNYLTPCLKYTIEIAFLQVFFQPF
jgi:hypothetical protein